MWVRWLIKVSRRAGRLIGFNIRRVRVKRLFEFIKFGSKMKDKQKKVREAFKKVEALSGELVTLRQFVSDKLTSGREKTLAQEALDRAAKAVQEVELAYVWAARSIRAEQVARNARRS